MERSIIGLLIAGMLMASGPALAKTAAQSRKCVAECMEMARSAADPTSCDSEMAHAISVGGCYDLSDGRWIPNSNTAFYMQKAHDECVKGAKENDNRSNETNFKDCQGFDKAFPLCGVE
jgi:hypothetical protein